MSIREATHEGGIEERGGREEGGGQAAHTAPGYLPVQTPLFKCLLWTRTPANWLQLTLYQDELENEHGSFPFGKKKKMEGSHTRTQSGGTCMQVENRQLALGQVAQLRDE